MTDRLLEEVKTKATLKEYRVENVRPDGACENDFPEMYGDEDNIWSFDKFKKNFQVIIVKLEDMEMEFDFVGLTCSIANAIRRTLLSDVPSMAIEKVFINNNTSVIRDEVLAHRLGLVPLKADPRMFEFRPQEFTEASDQDTLEYELRIKCTFNHQAKSNLPEDQYRNHHVYTKHLKWVPLGGQASLFKEANVQPIHLDILLNKLRPGHELDLKVHAIKGVGRDHAKFSPVATVSYRMLPEITLLGDITGDAAVRLQKCFSPGVITIETDESTGVKRAVVANARYDSCSRNVFRYDDLKNMVRLDRIRNHFIFSVESVGALPPDVLVVEAINILRSKCQRYIKELNVCYGK